MSLDMQALPKKYVWCCFLLSGVKEERYMRNHIKNLQMREQNLGDTILSSVEKYDGNSHLILKEARRSFGSVGDLSPYGCGARRGFRSVGDLGICE